MPTLNDFTPTQHRILKVLADGMRHKREELRQCLSDELSGFKNLRAHLSILRKRLRPVGQDILCELFDNGIYYRHVRLLASTHNGYH